jgi:hypothetical protein
MDAVWINFFYNPLLPLGILLSVLAAFAFLVFLRGFLSGTGYLFTLNGNDELGKLARIRVMWGFLLLVLFFCIWQALRWVGAVLTGSETPPGLGLTLILFILLMVGVWLVHFLKKRGLAGEA